MTPAPSLGTLAEELAVVETYLRLPIIYRRKWPRAAMAAARATILPHTREPRVLDLMYERRREPLTITAFTLHVDRRNGQPRRLVRLELQGREVHRDIIDTDSAWHRGLFVQAARGKEPISDDDVAWLDTALIDGAKQSGYGTGCRG